MREHVIAEGEAGLRLDLWLARHGEAGSRARAAMWIERGKVFLNGKTVQPAARSRRVQPGDRVGVWLDRPGSAAPIDRAVIRARRRLNVVHEDDAIVIVNKPPGMLVEPLPGRAGEEVTLVDLLADHFRHQARAGLFVVHRIDRDTSGLVLFARTPAARDALKRQFEQHTPERIYQAVFCGQITPVSGTWRDELAWDAEALRQRRAHGRDARAKEAVATYRVLEQFRDAALVEITLVTGKRNQIRVQAGLRGHPVVGERLYRFAAPPEPPDLPRVKRQALHAWRLGFLHPATHRRLSFVAPLADDLQALVRTLRASRKESDTASGRRRPSRPNHSAQG
jgi:23S rRNA pseudouridine1911/1915/1917 synthase